MKNGAESGKRHFDMIVVGGGMSGAATAYYLAKGRHERRADQRRRSICSGASGRNGGQVIQVEGRDELTRDVIAKKNSIASHGKKLLDTLNDELGVDIEYRKTGGLDLAYSDEDERVIKMVTKWQHEVGDTERRVPRRFRGQGHLPGARGGLRGGKYRADDGNANPFKITYGFALGALRLTALGSTPTRAVRSIMFEKGRAAGVSTDRGDFYARHGVVNATNAWTKLRLPRLPGRALQDTRLRDRAVPPDPRCRRPKRWSSTGKETRGTGKDNNQAYLFYGGSQKDGNIIIGGPPVHFPDDMDHHFNEDVTYDDFMRFRTLFARYWPGIEGVSHPARVGRRSRLHPRRSSPSGSDEAREPLHERGLHERDVLVPHLRQAPGRAHPAERKHVGARRFHGPGTFQERNVRMAREVQLHGPAQLHSGETQRIEQPS